MKEKDISSGYTTVSLFILILFTLMPACDRAEKKSDAPAETKMEKRLPRVKVAEAASAPFVKKVELIGVGRARKTVRVGTNESGIVKEVTFDKGDTVKKGSILVRIDDSTLRASLAELEASLEIAKLNYDKLTALKKGRGAVSEFDLKNAVLKKEMAAARAGILKTRLSRMKIKSPVAGIVEKKHVEPGEFIAPGSPVATIMDISEIKVEAGIAEKEIRHFKKGSEAEIVFDAYPDMTFRGVINYLSPDVDSSNGTFRIEMPVKNREGLLKPGMLARVTLVKERCDACILIDQDSVMDTGKGKAVFVVDHEKRARLKRVVLGETEKDRIVIDEGLKEGDRVVIVGQRSLVDGAGVEIVE